jgi:hypothetical protein
MKSSTWTRAWLLAGLVVCGATLVSVSERSRAEDVKTDAKAETSKVELKKADAPQVDLAPEAGYGTFKGQFVLDGALPATPPAGTLADAGGADIKLCGGTEVPDEKLVVDKATNGIANIFVYMKKAPAKIHPSLQKVPATEVAFDQKICQFLPHGLIVRVGQTVKVLSADPVPHNTHTHPLRNEPFNQVIAPKERTGIDIKFKDVERLPIGVTCDIHRWMRSWWLIVDHPYAAITDAEGKFAIGKIPAGEYEFVLWHEEVGYVKKGYKVKIPDNGVENAGSIKVPVADFFKKK